MMKGEWLLLNTEPEPEPDEAGSKEALKTTSLGADG